MKVLIVSDTHKRNEVYFQIVKREKPDAVIHCGDVEGYEEEIIQAAGCPVYMVAGNNDFFSELPKELEVELQGYKIWITHGHNYYVSMGNETIKREAIARGHDIVIYGHTHRPVVEESGTVIAINPGSISYPRQLGRERSYAIMNLEPGKSPDISIFFV